VVEVEDEVGVGDVVAVAVGVGDVVAVGDVVEVVVEVEVVVVVEGEVAVSNPSHAKGCRFELACAKAVSELTGLDVREHSAPAGHSTPATCGASPTGRSNARTTRTSRPPCEKRSPAVNANNATLAHRTGPG